MDLKNSYHGKSNWKPMYSTIAPEDIEIGKLYCISINPENQCDNTKTNRYVDRSTDLLCQWTTFLTKENHDSFNCKLFMETKNGRLHFHGFLQITCPIKFDVLFLPKLKKISTYEIDTISDLKVWYDYCTKQSELWKNLKLPYRIVNFVGDINQQLFNAGIIKEPVYKTHSVVIK